MDSAKIRLQLEKIFYHVVPARPIKAGAASIDSAAPPVIPIDPYRVNVFFPREHEPSGTILAEFTFGGQSGDDIDNRPLFTAYGDPLIPEWTLIYLRISGREDTTLHFVDRPIVSAIHTLELAPGTVQVLATCPPSYFKECRMVMVNRGAMVRGGL